MLGHLLSFLEGAFRIELEVCSDGKFVQLCGFPSSPIHLHSWNKIPTSFQSGANWQGKGLWSAVPNQNVDKLPSWAHACATCFGILWQKNFIESKIISAQKLTNSVLGSSKSGTATGSGDTHAASSLSSGATAQDVLKFLTRHTLDLEPSKQIYDGPIYDLDHEEFGNLRKEYLVLFGFEWDRTTNRYYLAGSWLLWK